jgi:hypothetical protein
MMQESVNQMDQLMADIKKQIHHRRNHPLQGQDTR